MPLFIIGIALVSALSLIAIMMDKEEPDSKSEEEMPLEIESVEEPNELV